MGNKRKRSSTQAVNATSAVVQSEPKLKKKKALFSKTLTTDSAKSLAVNVKVNEQKPVKSVAKIAVDGAKKKKKKKKNKSSGAAETSSSAVATEQKATKANASEIDDLFASLKTEKQKKIIAEEQQKLAEEEEERREKKEKERLHQQIKKLEAQNTNSNAAGLNPDPRPVRYDEDGLPIYSEASLQMGKGGDTADCPFDCWCCF